MNILPVHRGLLFALVFVVALSALVSRRPDIWLAPQFWGEDGTVFFQSAIIKGWQSWPVPYAGYFNLSSRTLACLTASLPWEIVPSVYVWFAGIVTGLVATRVAFSQLPVVPRVCGSVAMIAVPHSGEVFLNLTNINWILGILLVLNLLEPFPITRRETARRVAEVTIAGLSGAVIILLFPFALLWLWRTRRERRAWAISIAWGIAFAAQIAVLLTNPRALSMDARHILRDLPSVLPSYGSWFLLSDSLPFDSGLRYVVFAFLFVAIGMLLADHANLHRWIAGLLLIAAVGILAAGRLASDSWPDPLGRGGRYTYIPFVLMLWGFGWLLSGTRKLGLCVLAGFIYLLPLAFALPHWKSHPIIQLDWPQQVREARAGTRNRFYIPPNWTFPVPPFGPTGPK